MVIVIVQQHECYYYHPMNIGTVKLITLMSWKCYHIIKFILKTNLESSYCIYLAYDSSRFSSQHHPPLLSTSTSRYKEGLSTVRNSSKTIWKKNLKKKKTLSTVSKWNGTNASKTSLLNSSQSTFFRGDKELYCVD